MWRLLFVLLFFASSATAQIGEIADIEGSGVVKRDSEKIKGELGIGVQMADKIITAKGRMQLHFSDETRVDVTEHSAMVIDEFIYDPAQGTGALKMRATLGAVRYASGQIAKTSRQRVSIKTPSATIGVRGTDFIMIVDEIGGSMVTLLPSCDDRGFCMVGEITVESDAGIVIMNQAYQTTIVKHSAAPPAPPKILDLPDDLLRAMLIVRKTSPYDEINEEAVAATDILKFDFLAFDDLDADLLNSDELWVTDLSNQSYLNEMFVDELTQALKELFTLLTSLLDLQAEEFMRIQVFGYDPETGINLEDQPPNYVFTRTENTHTVRLTLNENYGYNIDLIQNDFSVFDYSIGVGANDIYINQQEN